MSKCISKVANWIDDTPDEKPPYDAIQDLLTLVSQQLQDNAALRKRNDGMQAQTAFARGEVKRVEQVERRLHTAEHEKELHRQFASAATRLADERGLVVQSLSRVLDAIKCDMQEIVSHIVSEIGETDEQQEVQSDPSSPRPEASAGTTPGRRSEDQPGGVHESDSGTGSCARD